MTSKRPAVMDEVLQDMQQSGVAEHLITKPLAEAMHQFELASPKSALAD